MTIKQFIEEAKKIGCKDAYISAHAEGVYFSGSEKIEITYKVWCGECRKHTKDYAIPEQALTEFRAMHDVRDKMADMVLTDAINEYAPEQPAFFRKIMD